MRGTLTPKACTSPGFSVAARRRAPSWVFSISSQVNRHMPPAATTTQRRYFGMNMKPRSTGPDSACGMR